VVRPSDGGVEVGEQSEAEEEEAGSRGGRHGARTVVSR
jgi:hypothetical protein